MSQEQFIGTWKLIVCKSTTPDDQVFYPYGKDASGLLMYDAVGYMSVQLMRPNRPAFAVNNLVEGTPKEIKSAFEGMITYYGTYSVNEEEGAIIHRVQSSSFPNWIGKEQKRFFEFEGNSLTLSTPPIRDGEQAFTGVLVWQRV